jgi:large subunit ribosomal protein L16|mmetsp:Transcript_7483/g.12408  ORF Transcript_7483/g.12408 Transcript_7483/m.12408 type:complete len:137 (-) Transcript_7483:1283-1693(-)
MLSQPKKTKFKKNKKNYLSHYIETKSNRLTKGLIGLKALESTRLTSRQIESVRQSMNRNLNRKGKIWLHMFPHISVTEKPTENRMGKGKGSVAYWFTPIKVGTIFLEIGGVSFLKAKQALLKGAKKLPIKTKIMIR